MAGIWLENQVAVDPALAFPSGGEAMRNDRRDAVRDNEVTYPGGGSAEC